jgi:hypothetical protein
MGFSAVEEAVTYKKYRLSAKTSVTYIANAHDNIVVIEAGGRVLVNANDALHASPRRVIDSYVSVLRARWPRIDLLFCGFGGANYFPNTLHLEGKDDWAIGAVREQLFAHNFCRVVAGLKPRIAVPFAADFALLAPQQRWINEVRFPRANLKSYYRKYFGGGAGGPEIIDMYPGDRLDDDQLRAASPYRQRMKNGGLERLLDEQYAQQSAAPAEPHPVSDLEAAQLGEQIRENIERRAKLFKAETLRALKFCLRVADVAAGNCFNVSFSGDAPQIQRAPAPAPDTLLILDISSRILRHCMSTEWGGEAIKIGYGCDIHLTDRRAAAANLDIVCVQLLTRYPTPGSYMKSHPLRTAAFALRNFKGLVRNPLIRAWALGRLKRSGREVENYDRSIWLLRDSNDIRRLYNLPELEAELKAHA